MNVVIPIRTPRIADLNESNIRFPIAVKVGNRQWHDAEARTAQRPSRMEAMVQ